MRRLFTLLPALVALLTVALSGCSNDEGDDRQTGAVDGSKFIVLDRVEIAYDTGGDHVVNPGERVAARVFVRNTGTATVAGVSAEVVGAPDVVKLEESKSTEKQDIRPGDTPSSPVVEVSFVLPLDAPAAPLNFDLRFADGGGNGWRGSFSVPVSSQSAHISVAKAVVTSDTNNDGMLNPGEQATIEILATNSGGARSREITAALSSAPESVSVIGSSASLRQEIAPGDIPTLPILSVSLAVPAGTPLGELPLGIDFYDALGNHWQDTARVEIVATNASPKVAVGKVLADQNADGLASPGEEVTVGVLPINDGTSIAVGLWATLGQAPPEVEIISCASGETLCDAGCNCSTPTKQTLTAGESSSVPLLQLKLRTATTASGQVSIPVVLHDQSGNTWPSALLLPLSKSDAALTAFTATRVTDQNGDGVIMPGESATVAFFLKNHGKSTAVGVSASLTSAPSEAQIVSCSAGGAVNCSSCDCSSSGWTQNIIGGDVPSLPVLTTSFVVNPNAPLSPLVFGLSMTDAWGNGWSDSFTVQVGPLRRTEACERGALRLDAPSPRSRGWLRAPCTVATAHHRGRAARHEETHPAPCLSQVR